MLSRIFGPKRDTRKNYLKSSFIVCTVHEILLGERGRV
jgi:hypothetical protein